MTIDASTDPKPERFGWPNDANLMRAIFFGLLSGTAALLYLDFQTLSVSQPDATPFTQQPILPAVDRPEIDPNAPQYNPGDQVTIQPDILLAPISATLAPNGIMLLSGYIEAGASVRIIKELDRTNEYIKTVQINSPGGSVNDALEIAVRIRELGLSTGIEDGGFCASSCPLMFAGGKTRFAGARATIGLHQIYGATAKVTAPQAMSDAQTTTARITKFLHEMGVDPAIWIHALETPPDRLYYLNQSELQQFKLVTKMR